MGCIEALRRQVEGHTEGALDIAEKYIHLAEIAHSRDLDADEWMYGRAGYLHGLLLLHSVVGIDIGSVTLSIAEVILANGQQCAKALDSEWLLMWKSDAKNYLGAA